MDSGRRFAEERRRDQWRAEVDKLVFFKSATDLEEHIRSRLVKRHQEWIFEGTYGVIEEACQYRDSKSSVLIVLIAR